MEPLGPLGPLGPWDHWDHGTMGPLGPLGPWDHWDHFVIFEPGTTGEQASGGSKSSKMMPFCYFKPWTTGEQASGGKRFSKNALFRYKKQETAQKVHFFCIKALGKQKHRFSLGFSRFEAKNIDFPLVFKGLGPKIGPQFRQKVQKSL